MNPRSGPKPRRDSPLGCPAKRSEPAATRAPRTEPSYTAFAANQFGVLRQRSRRRFCRPFVVFGINHQAPTHPFAFALRNQVSFLAQRQVNNPPLPRRHRAELVGRSSLANL